MTQEVTAADLPYLRRCVELATEAVEAGDFPFGSVLVAADGAVLAEDRNREVTAGDPTRHPEFELAREWPVHLWCRHCCHNFWAGGVTGSPSW